MIRESTRHDARGLTKLLGSIEDLSGIANESAEATLERIQKHLEIITQCDRHTLLVFGFDNKLVGYIQVH